MVAGKLDEHGDLYELDIWKVAGGHQTVNIAPAIGGVSSNIYSSFNVSFAGAEPVTDAQVKTRYDEVVASLGKEEYKPRVIVVPDVAMAATVSSELKAGRAFDVLARQYSMATRKVAGGELPWASFKTPPTEGNTQ